MKYIEVMKEEMQEVLEQLKPHFEEYGELEISENHIVFVNNKCNTSFKRRKTIVYFTHNSIDNVFYEAYYNLSLNAKDVFEKVGTNLKDLKIKQVPKFDINEWKKDFVERNNLALRIENGVVYRGNRKIINKDNDVNWSAWHNNIFEIKHKLFKFDGCDSVYLKTKEECEEFERVYEIMDKYLRGIPDLNKGE